MRKVITLLLTAMMIFGSMMCVCAETDDKTTDVEYTVDEGYEWTVPAAASPATAIAITTSGAALGDVAITKLIIDKDSSLIITISSDFTLTPGSDNVSYEVSFKDGSDETTNKWAAVTTGANVLNVAAGSTSGLSQTLYSKVTGTAKFAGDYTDTITFTASVSGAPK